MDRLYPKRREYANSMILNMLMSLSSESKDPTKTENSLKNIIANLQKCQETRQIPPVELMELEAMEKELLGFKKYYKENANQLIVYVYATKIKILVVYIIFLVLAIIYGIYHKNNQGPPDSGTIVDIVLAMMFITIIVMSFMLSDLFKVTLLPDEEVLENLKKSVKSEEKVTSIMLMNQQNKLIDRFFKGVEPMRKNADYYFNRRITLTYISSIPSVMLLLMSMGIILNRAITQWDMQQFSSFILVTVTGIVISPFIVFM